MKHSIVGLAAGCLAAFLVCVAAAEAAAPPQPAITPAQIEADWARQEQLRRFAPGGAPQNVTKEEDAAGACDGVKDGKWGFHTLNEPNPWWQVDLGQPVALGRVVLYNRCDFAERNAHIMVLLSQDGKEFKQAYQNDGKVFYGFTDKKPLEADLAGARARYVRLQLPGTNYFHLDEVEIYPPGSQENIALGKPATQSSTSEWSARHTPASQPKAVPTDVVVERGLKLAERLARLGANVEPQAQVVRQVSERLQALPADAPEPARRELHTQARWAVRRMALSSPLLDFDTILFAKNASPMLPHMSDQFYGWWSKPGGGLWLLEGFKGDTPRVRCLTSEWAPGSFIRPNLSYDGKRVLFAYAKYYPHVRDMEKVDKDKLPEDCFYHIYEMGVDGSGLRQLTRGRYDDFDARYLPSGEIVFLSTRKGQFLQVGKSTAMATCQATLPDSYVRCGGGSTRPVAVFTLHVMNADGGEMRQISAFENFEWTPAVAADGRIIYARWDYIDRFNGPYESLWSTNPDGTNPQLVYGNFTSRPQCVFEAVPVPNSQRLMFTACAHHSNIGGSLVLLDRTQGTEEERPLQRVTPEVCFPETEGWPEHYYANPYPLSEDLYLVSWADRPLPPHTLCAVDDPRNPDNASGIYLYDSLGNLELLYRDPQIASINPLAVRPRPKPPVVPSTVDFQVRQEGRLLLQDVYRGLSGAARGAVKRLRIVAVPPKVQPQMNSPNLGVSSEDPGKFVLGTVPVEEDGSAYFRVPSGVPLFFQALDGQGRMMQTMRTLTYVQPGQTASCIGCHEARDLAPPVRRTPLAARREPSKLTLGPEGTWPLRYDQLVQPVMDKLCVGCHKPDSGDAKAAALDLTAAKSYENLLAYGNNDLKQLAFEKPASLVGESPSMKSKLMALLTQEKGHAGVQLDADSYQRLVTWMDTYAQRQGSFSDAQEAQLREFRQALSEMIATGP